MADDGPVNKVPRVIDRNTGEILKGACREKVVGTHTADGGVGVEAADDGISHWVEDHDALVRLCMRCRGWGRK